MEFSVDNLCGFLIRSKLMTPDEGQAMRQRWVGEAKKEQTRMERAARAVRMLEQGVRTPD